MWPFTRKTNQVKSSIPDGWTDDLNIPLHNGQTVEELVGFIIQAALDNNLEDIGEQLALKFSLSEEEAELARDRTFGGIFRAKTQNPANCPERKLDPVAWTSYQRAIQEPSLIQKIYPDP